MLQQVSRVVVHVHFSHPIARHRAASNLPSCVTLQMKSAVTPFWCRLTLLFLSSDRFVHLAEEIELETWTGIGLFFFFPSACFPICFWLISSIFLAEYWQRIPPAVPFLGKRWGWGLLGTLIGWLSISTPRQIYYSPLQKILHSKHIILPITPALH